MQIKYKSYWRKTGLKKDWGNLFLQIVNEHKPKVFLEVGVFCGVTARNVCELLKEVHSENFKYVGIDLFGERTSQSEKVPNYLKKQKFSNHIKNSDLYWQRWYDFENASDFPKIIIPLILLAKTLTERATIKPKTITHGVTVKQKVSVNSRLL